MAKKSTAADKAALAQAAAQYGIDLSRIDWQKVIQIVQLLVALFNDQANDQGLKASGCPDEDLDHCAACCEAGHLALQSAMVSFDHCRECCQ